MNRKGQLSIELVVLLAVFLLFFQAMILPSIEFAENVLKDTHAIIISKKNIDNLATNVEQFASQDGYGVRQVYFYLPSNTIMDCNSTAKTIDYNITVSNQRPLPLTCKHTSTGGLCAGDDFRKAINIDANFDCNMIGPGHLGGTLKIIKDATGDVIITE